MKKTLMPQPNSIKIHDNDTRNTGTYTVWFMNGEKWASRTCTEAFVNGCLNMRQKEAFFMGKDTFAIELWDWKILANSNPSEVLKSKYEA
jgi:hypothetical protein